MYPVHKRNNSIKKWSEINVSGHSKFSKLVCPHQGKRVSLESCDIIGVPLDIHLGNFCMYHVYKRNNLRRGQK